MTRKSTVAAVLFCFTGTLKFVIFPLGQSMESAGVISIILILVNVVFSYRGFKDFAFFQQYSFDISRIRLYRDYKRFLTSGFLHSGWMHLIFNMVALYSFGKILESSAGIMNFLIIYFVSLLAGNLLSLYVNRLKSNYTSIGASGAISGVVFATIGMFPDMRMSLLFIPISLPGWIFGLMYVVYCMFGIRSQRDNIGHDAHLGGGITGLLLAVAMYPHILGQNYFPILLILVPAMIFLFLVLTRPEFLILERPFSKDDSALTIEDRYNSSKRMKELELDRLLDKISTHGIHSLTRKEKERLEELSKVK